MSNWLSSGVEDGAVYTVQVMVEDDQDDCNGKYLAYDPKSNSSRPFLMSESATKPVRWKLQKYDDGVYSLETADRDPSKFALGKLSYPPQCNQRSVKISRSDRLRWTFEEQADGMYKIIAIKDCNGRNHNAILAPATLRSGRSTCRNQRSLSLLSISTNESVYWNFTKINS